MQIVKPCSKIQFKMIQVINECTALSCDRDGKQRIGCSLIKRFIEGVGEVWGEVKRGLK